MRCCRRRRLLSLAVVSLAVVSLTVLSLGTVCATNYVIFIIRSSFAPDSQDRQRNTEPSSHGSLSIADTHTKNKRLSNNAIPTLMMQGGGLYSDRVNHRENSEDVRVNADTELNDEIYKDLDKESYPEGKYGVDTRSVTPLRRRNKLTRQDKGVRSLSETWEGVHSATPTLSSSVQRHPNFVKENTDLFTNEGHQSDYLFRPCQDIPSSGESDPLYGFVGPFRYLANYKNPCWIMEQGKTDAPVIYCVPYFYLVGAPKAGSTDLYKRITMHPDVVKPVTKETRWFDRTRFTDNPHFSSFLRNFYNATTVISRSLVTRSNFHSRITGDGSPSYFFDNRHWPLIPGNEGCSEPRVTVASHIHHLYPQAKIIFILRNPVDRLYSSYLYNHAKYEGVSSERFDRYVRDAVTLYNDCFARHSLRQCANNATVFTQAKVMLVVSLYSVFIRDWVKLFPREQLLVIATEKYSQDMKFHLVKIFDFLGLRTLNSTELNAIADLTVHNVGQHYQKTGPMLTQTRSLLDSFYRPYNQDLANLLNNPDFLWQKKAQD